MFSLKYRHRLSGPIRDELDQFVTGLRDYLLVAHDQDGNIDASTLNLSNLNASNLSTGTVPVARLSGITNGQISAAAAIVASKLDLSAIAQDLKFVDATYDLGKSGATRPRDLFLSRNATIGGSLTLPADPTIASTHATTTFTLDIKNSNAVTPTLLLTNSAGNAPSLTVGGGQIIFPATQNASSGANTLDDYEEGAASGAWTPSDASGAALSFSVDSATYIKIGQLVIATANIGYPITADGNNSAIGGLPFTCQSTTNNVWGGAVTFSTETTFQAMQVVTGDTKVLPYTNGGARVSNATLSADTFRIVVIYRASA